MAIFLGLLTFTVVFAIGSFAAMIWACPEEE